MTEEIPPLPKLNPVNSLRFRYWDGGPVIVWGPAVWHPQGTKHEHGTDTSGVWPTHEYSGSWCQPIFVNKSGWVSSHWEPRWWDPDRLLTPEEVIEHARQDASNEMFRAADRYAGKKRFIEEQLRKYEGVDG